MKIFGYLTQRVDVKIKIQNNENFASNIFRQLQQRKKRINLFTENFLSREMSIN